MSILVGPQHSLEREKKKEREKKSIAHQRCYKIESFKPIKPVLYGALMRGEE